jgi:hypothetical protein
MGEWAQKIKSKKILPLIQIITLNNSKNIIMLALSKK